MGLFKKTTVDTVKTMTDQVKLFEIARNHKDNKVRSEAVRKLTDQRQILDFLMNDSDADVLCAAADTFLLLEQISVTGSPDYGACENAFENIRDERLLGMIAMYCSHSISQYIAAEKINDPIILAHLAQNNNVASVVARKLNNQSLLNEMASNENMDSIARSYAIKKINDQSVLAGIARKGGRYLAGDNGMGTDHFNLHLLAVKHLTDQKILADLAENSEDEYIRNTAIKRIDELNNR